MREVYIDGKLADVEESQHEGYIFTSPLFRDFSSIASNRSTTVKMPNTSNNRTIFRLSNLPNIITDFPYIIHTYKEYRGGLLFIDGICVLLKTTHEAFEIAVKWGTGIGLSSLKEAKLRELEADVKNPSDLDYIKLNIFLSASSDSQAGFIVADFGLGAGKVENSHPSVTISYILSLITKYTGVEFNNQPDIFKKTWIPLIDKYANELIWQDYEAVTGSGLYVPSSIARFSYIKLAPVISGNPDIISTPLNISVIKGTIDSTIVVSGLAILTGITQQSGTRVRLFATKEDDTSEVFTDQHFDIIDGKCDMQINMSIELSEDTNVWLLIQYVYGGNVSGIDDGATIGITNQLTITRKQTYVNPGLEKFPTVPNLPDMTVQDFIKVIMQMFGLFTYYEYNQSSGINAEKVTFIPISKIYSRQNGANDYTNKLLNTSGGRFNLSFTYGDYARKNNFKYKADDDVLTNANGYLLIDNQTLEAEKDIHEVPFSPSDNVIDANGNTFARINLYKMDGEEKKTNNPKYRILAESSYVSEYGYVYKSGVFDSTLHFMGNNGLISKYYKEFQAIIERPVVAECYVYLKNAELYNFSELTPIYIDGIYYMLLKATVQNNGIATLQLIKMPPIR